MDKELNGKWIQDPKFSGLGTINVFHKELEVVKKSKHPKELINRHMYIRKSFEINKKRGEYVLDITSDDYYKLYINGEYIAQGPALGYYFHYYFNRFNVTKYLKEGKNVIFVHVYYQGLINRVWNSKDLRMGMIAKLYNDDKAILETDSDWKYYIPTIYKSSKTVGYDTQFLENIDFREKVDGVRNIEFDDSNWENVLVNAKDDHKLYLQETSVVKIYTIAPKSVKKIRKDCLLIDFGKEITGQLYFEASGESGDRIIVKHAEELDENNMARYKLRCDCEYYETHTLSGKEKDCIDYYDYKAFRFAQIECKEGLVNIDSIKAIIRHYPMDEERCNFLSSDTLMNDIWDICKRAVMIGTQEAYLDCPSREKGQYLGDATVTTLSHMYLSGDTKLYRKMLEDFSLSRYISKGLMAVAPGSLMQEIADYSLQWPLQLLKYYRHTGDIEFLNQMYETCIDVLEYFEEYENEDGLIEEVKEKWNLVDWPENLRDNYDFNLSKPISKGVHNVINAFYLNMIKTVNEIRDILGISYVDEFNKHRKAYIDAFYDKERKLFTDSKTSNHASLHSNSLALCFDLAPRDSYQNITCHITKKGFSCGVYMAFFVLKALINAKEYEKAYNLITNKTTKSYSNMLKEGATTCFEAWGKDQKWNTSLCHPWASAPIILIIEDIMGIKPLNPGWQSIQIKPNIPDKIKEINFNLKFSGWEIEIIKKHGKIKINKRRCEND